MSSKTENCIFFFILRFLQMKQMKYVNALYSYWQLDFTNLVSSLHVSRDGVSLSEYRGSFIRTVPL